ncbi:carbohydrate ABC transporter permease [Paenibacillus thalictri]|uniref:Carbohydrate ABC transporter permease n=1 Tax=Paenibacillus thalictri TaxID=2527873 RepID=A0A4Q9DTS9_9BACL|nr:carbohydrate ABC transporter permease [Paenibacillus thalictri]TBL79110.1 carbohydrate ABC transporter permease [Paenibacillus thalictri]
MLSTKPKAVGKTIYECVLVVMTAVYLFPFYIMVTQSLKSPQESMYNPLGLPQALQTDNFTKVWKLMRFGEAFSNSFWLTLVSVVGIALVSGICSFAIARRASKGYVILYYIFVCGLLIPFYMTLSPLIKLMKDLQLINSLMGLALAYIGRGIPFAVFLYVGFIRAIPKEIMESAVIDGCSPNRLYWSIVFPMVRNITSTLIILNALWVWNDFLFPLLTLQNVAQRTIPLAQYMFYGQYNTEWNLAFASYLLSILPLVLIYFFMQRQIIEGISTGGVKS